MSYRERATDPRQYDRGEVNWDREGSGSHYMRRLYREALHLDKLELAGKRALDIGCGSGWLVSDLADAGATVVGIDASEVNVRQARTLYPDLQFVLSSLSDYSPGVTFEIVFAVMVMEHFEDLDSSYSLLRGLLKPGGRLIAISGDFDKFSQPRFGYSVTSELVSTNVVATRTDYGSRMGVLYDMVRSPSAYLDSAQRAGLQLDRYVPVGAPPWLNAEEPRYLEYAGTPLFHRFDFSRS